MAEESTPRRAEHTQGQGGRQATPPATHEATVRSMIRKYDQLLASERRLREDSTADDRIVYAVENRSRSLRVAGAPERALAGRTNAKRAQRTGNPE